MNFASCGVKQEYPNPPSPYDGIKRGGTNRFDFLSPLNPQYLKFGFSPAEGGPMTTFEMALTNIGSGAGIFDSDGFHLGVNSYKSADGFASFSTLNDLPWNYSHVPVPEPTGIMYAILILGPAAVAELRKRRRSKIRDE